MLSHHHSEWLSVSPVSSVVMWTSLLHLQHHCRNCGGIYCMFWECPATGLQLKACASVWLLLHTIAGEIQHLATAADVFLSCSLFLRIHGLLNSWSKEFVMLGCLVLVDDSGPFSCWLSCRNWKHQCTCSKVTSLDWIAFGFVIDNLLCGHC